MLSCKLPTECVVACSGGPDSIGAFSFLHNVPGRVKGLIFIDHGTIFSAEGYTRVNTLSDKFDIPLDVFKIECPEKNQEAFWHYRRNEIFQGYKYPVITAHHLDDQVEQFLLTFLKSGRFMPIPPVNGNIYRPFLFHTKEQLQEFAVKRNLWWLNDPDNENRKRHRNYVRHELVPRIERDMGIGLKKVVRKLLVEKFGEENGEE